MWEATDPSGMDARRSVAPGLVAVGILAATAGVSHGLVGQNAGSAVQSSSVAGCSGLTIGLGPQGPHYDDTSKTVVASDVRLTGLGQGCVGRSFTVTANGPLGPLGRASFVVRPGQQEAVAMLSGAVPVTELSAWTVTAR